MQERSSSTDDDRQSETPNDEAPSGSEFTPDIEKWLNAVPNRLDRVTELVYKNGGTIEFCGQFGVHESGGPYGRAGLTLDEAFELIFLNGFINGCCYWAGSEKIALKVVELVEKRLNEVVSDPPRVKILLPGES